MTDSESDHSCCVLQCVRSNARCRCHRLERLAGWAERPRAPLMCQRQTAGKKKKKNFGKNGGGCNVSQRVAGSNGYEFFNLQALLTSSRCLNQSYDIYVVLWLCLEVVWTTEDLNPLLSLRRFWEGRVSGLRWSDNGQLTAKLTPAPGNKFVFVH